MRDEGSKPLLASSSASPLVMRISCSTVIARRGSAGSRQAGTGAGAPTASRPCRTRTPMSAFTTDLFMDHESIGVSVP